MVGSMDIRDPNLFDMNMNGSEGIGDKIRAIFSENHSLVKICEIEVNMEAPDTDAEIRTAFTDAFTGAARNVDQVVCEADVGGSLDSTYFWFYVATAQHYIWLDVDNGGSDPSVAGTAHEVDISANDNAATVGAAIQAVIDAIANITCTGTTTLLIENDNVGIVTAAAFDGASTSTGFAFSNIIAGTAAYTANYFYLVSTDAKEATAGVGTQLFRVFIIDENGVPSYTDIIPNGTTAVKSSVKALDIYGLIGLEAGSEGDTAGTVTLLDWGVNDVYATLAAAGMGSVSARCWVPAGWNAIIGDIRAYILEVNTAAADIDLELGTIITPLIAGEPSGVGRDLIEQFILTHFNLMYRNDFHDIADGGNGAYMTLNHVTVADDKNTSHVIKIRYILWSD